MTEVKNTDNPKNSAMSKRMQRRRLLKTGALAAPVALTLHGGVPLAHADSAGLCAMELVEIANNTNDPRSAYLQIPMKGNRIAPPANSLHHKEIVDINDYEQGTQLVPFNGSMTHWEFVGDPTNNRFGFSCASSIIVYNKIKGNNGFGNGDQPAPGNSLPNNNAENGPRGNPN